MIKKILLLFIIICISFISFKCVTYFNERHLTNKFIKVTMTASDLKKSGIVISDFKGKPIISCLHAVNIAKREWWGNKTKDDNISAQINLMTYSSMKNSPVWIVSLKGLKDPPISVKIIDGKKPAPIRYHTESNVVIDATTGKILFGFSFR